MHLDYSFTLFHIELEKFRNKCDTINPIGERVSDQQSLPGGRGGVFRTLKLFSDNFDLLLDSWNQLKGFISDHVENLAIIAIFLN